MSERIKHWPGKRLSSKELEKGGVTTTRTDPNVKYAWACGEAMSRFLEELKKGKLIARKCNSCEQILFPPRMFCEDCFTTTNEWVYVKDTGIIQTYSSIGTAGHNALLRRGQREDDQDRNEGEGGVEAREGKGGGDHRHKILEALEEG
jgi:hypothetical protein